MHAIHRWGLERGGVRDRDHARPHGQILHEPRAKGGLPWKIHTHHRPRQLPQVATVANLAVAPLQRKRTIGPERPERGPADAWGELHAEPSVDLKAASPPILSPAEKGQHLVEPRNQRDEATRYNVRQTIASLEVLKLEGHEAPSR